VNAAALLDRLAAAGGRAISPPVTLASQPVFELLGEAIGARLCAFPGGPSGETCLRPDMTLPIAMAVAAGVQPAGRYHYSGPVFRLPATSGEALEFEQAGFEWFGEPASAEADAEAVALALDAARAGGAEGLELRLGDVGLYGAVVDALEAGPRWSARLKAAFFRAGGPVAVLRAGDAPDSALAARLAALAPAEAERALEEVFALAGVEPVGGRSLRDIAERLAERGAAGEPPRAAAEALSRLLALDAPVGEAAAAVAGGLRAAGLAAGAADEAIAALEARLKAILALDPPFVRGARFAAHAGRRFEYYSGVVFEAAAPGRRDRPAVAGGRYDGLVRALGGADAPAIGGAVRLDRLPGAGA
jgi:ATP phosphoribosyltransferase regulatory subunit